MEALKCDVEAKTDDGETLKVVEEAFNECY